MEEFFVDMMLILLAARIHFYELDVIVELN